MLNLSFMNRSFFDYYLNVNGIIKVQFAFFYCHIFLSNSLSNLRFNSSQSDLNDETEFVKVKNKVNTNTQDLILKKYGNAYLIVRAGELQEIYKFCYGMI